MDVKLFDQMGEEFAKRFEGKKITKILTIEASGIGIASVVALHFGVPVVFAKKSKSINLDGDMYTAEVVSFTHKTTNNIIVSKKFLSEDDSVLIIDDFLANGCALQGLIQIVNAAGAGGRHRHRHRKGLPEGRPDHQKPRLPARISCHRRQHGRRNRHDKVPRAVVCGTA